MLAFFPFNKPLSSLDSRLAKHILLPDHHSNAGWEARSMRFRPSVPIESRRPRAREDPCLFRTRLADQQVDDDPDAGLFFESTDEIDCDDVKFDDSQCVSVGRTVEKFKTMPKMSTRVGKEAAVARNLGPHLYAIPTDTATSSEEDGRREPAGSSSSSPFSSSALAGNPPVLAQADGEPQVRPFIQKEHSDPTTTIYRAHLASENGDNNDEDAEDAEDAEDGIMETMNMPFWILAQRQKRHHTRLEADGIPDDMSIITDISLIPSYFPSDVMKQQRPQRHALLKRIVLAKARAARQTMRQLKRSCRDAVGNVFLDRAVHRPPECVRVGSAF
ncbi:uncharacterized protein THITE_2113142 [Thermothielavioides terrestris NRRL 8126]|uniref:Uncharacterized protein n=1 Tax=Thermothielavioides terrestris (strain ATCC 38088 / NRRL 8126) TaxID=578455 RepID=G2R1X7_THETT|nr:uncharacterized protein THITE_2113142 [Thermothielavioides terrestris NRRL 8126]AEO65758.1 hypothetical protein THITE_2113142 [Thermothielavioides terrestris NRRL 8126]